MNIANNLSTLHDAIPDEVVVVAVSKTKPPSDILEAYNSGHRVFGENRAQEMASKYEQLPKDIKWHAIGHLQRNKVKYIASFVSLIHSVDTIKLLNTIESEGVKHERVIDCLLQVHIGQEETKSGFTVEELDHLLNGSDLKALEHVRIKGLMGMASNTDLIYQIRAEFQTLKNIFNNF